VRPHRLSFVTVNQAVPWGAPQTGETDLKRLKDIDTAARTYFIRVYCWVLFPMLFITIFLPVRFGIKIAIILLGTPVATLVVMAITGFVGGSAGMLYSGGRARVPLREQLEGDLTKARVSKTEKRFEDALASVESALAKDPEFPEALLLKAQILWEGFADGPTARSTVMKVLHLETDKTTPVYRWAGELYKEIAKGQPSAE